MHGTTYFHRSCTTNFFVAIKCQFFSLSKMDPNQYNYQCYYNYLQNQSLPTNENSQNPSQYIMYRPPKSSKKFQNPPQYVMCPPPLTTINVSCKVPITQDCIHNNQLQEKLPPKKLFTCTSETSVEPSIT